MVRQARTETEGKEMETMEETRTEKVSKWTGWVAVYGGGGVLLLMILRGWAL